MNIKSLFIALAAVSAMSCSDSYEIDMPAEPDKPAAAPTASTTLIYQANPRFFANNNCIAAINDRLSDIANMGTTTLWVMPVCQPGEEKSIGSPYCIRNFTAMNERYGTIEDFKSLVTKAHAAGMTVILDWIANHTSWDHVWTSQHPEYYERDADGNIKQASSWSDVAQLDYSNTDLRNAMIEAMLYWVRETDIDGFRCDYADGVEHSFWSEAITALRAQKSDLMMLAESSDSNFYDDGFDMIYGWSYATQLQQLFTGKATTSKFFSALETELAAIPEGKSTLHYVLNHDVAAENDIATLYGSVDALPAAYALTAMLGGTPMLYSGMESTVSSGKMSFFTYNPLTWSDARQAKYAAISKAYAATADVRNGRLRSYSTGSVASFSRETDAHTLYVAVNTSATETTLKTPITFVSEPMSELISGRNEALPVTITLGAYDYVIYYK